MDNILPTRCSPEFLSELVKILKSPTVVFNQQGMIRHLSLSWSGLLSVPASTFSQLFDQRDRADASALVSRLTGIDSVTNFECRLPNGRWALVTVQKLDCDDRAPLWLGTTADIHESKSLHRDLTTHNQIQQMLLNVSSDCIKLLAPHGHVQYANAAGCRILNIDPAGGFGQEWIKLLPRDVWSQAEAALEQALSGETARFVGPSHDEKGRIEVWDSLLTPKCEPDGRVSSILCISRDVTESYRVSEELRRSQKRLAIASRAGKLGIWGVGSGLGQFVLRPDLV
ncbi:MAG: PAS domain-containing protein [Janthinobacterium lividum]